MGSLRPDRIGAGWLESQAITKIITSAILALLMVIGAWTASHAEPDALVHPNSVPVAGQASVIDAPASYGLSVVVAGDSGGPTLGLATCLLGALCGLALAVFFRSLRRDRGASILSISRASPSRPSRPTGRAPVAATLTQLSISRT